LAYTSSVSSPSSSFCSAGFSFFAGSLAGFAASLACFSSCPFFFPTLAPSSVDCETFCARACVCGACS
jgi:hypothetical protein